MLENAQKSIIFLFFLLVTNVYGQKITITGTIVDSIAQAIPRASIVASLDQKGDSILGYTVSDKNGYYVLNLKNTLQQKEFWLSFRHISYAAQIIKYENKSQYVKTTLKLQSNLLDEIILEAQKKVVLKGDTITYRTDAIKKTKDYSIEDVISRIPGVKIAENGQISYNNKIISHLYINDVDLLEGRYNIATRGIPAEAVEEIDILKNHNHARIDKGISDSDDIAFNLKIKKDHSLIFGSAKADIGLPLLTRNLEVTPIYLTDKFQDIASGKTNNFGKSLQNNGENLTPGNTIFDQSEINPVNILSAPNISGSSISNRYWLDNNSVSLTNDLLLKSSKDLILKAGANYNYNDNEIKQTSNQVYFFDADSTLVNNETKNELKNNDFYIGLIQEINRENLYLKNKTTINGEQSEGFSKIVQNENPLDYTYNDETKSIKNITEFKTKIKKSIINSGLLLKRIESNEEIAVIPSVFTSQIPNSDNSAQTNQNISTKQFSVGAYGAYNFNIGKIKSEFKQLIHWSSESLKSDLTQLSNSTPTQSPFPFTSNFRLNTLESASSFNSTINFNRFSILFNPNIQYINLDQKELLSTELDTQNEYLFFEPRTTFKYKIDYQWNVTLMGNYLSNVSRFSELYNGLVLKNFNNLYRNPNEVNVTRSSIGIFSIGYTNILKGFLFSNATSISNSSSDFVLSSTIDTNGLVQTEAINLPNKRTNFMNTTNLTKSFFRILKTDLTYKFNQITLNQIFNNIFQETNITTHTLDIGIGIDNNTWYGFKYEGSANFGKSKANGFSSKNTFLKQNLELDFYLSSKARLNIGTESVFSSFSSSTTDNTNTLFNTEFFYKPSKKLFLRASFINILNEQFFTTVQNGPNFVSTSQFSLRPRQFTIGLNFSF